MADGFVPPQAVRNNAKRGLELREKYGRGGTAVGVARARDLSNGKSISLETIRRMVSYFARHEVDKKGEGWGKDSAGYIAWLLWGGDAGRSWANRINDESKKKDKSMATDYANSYASIIKYDKNDDGTLMVYGKATDDTLDLDQQICDPAWLDTAMPAWFKSGGNIREMHTASAAGVAKEYEAKADGHYISVHVVDPIAVKKVENRVYQGFSIGIKQPRVVRDNKAVNGRIIDGQIIEVSLVDRPANPSAKLILAKSVEGESTLVQVEEMHEYKAPLPSDVFKSKKGSKMELIKQITELAKSLKPETVKFDKEAYDKAMEALADLIVVEANEMKEGHDERMSLAHLLEAVNHLKQWHSGEEAEGEVVAEAIELSAQIDEEADDANVFKADSTADCDCEGCKLCKEDGGCDEKMCKGHAMDKSATKCLECGCHQPSDSHGRDDVSTAEIVTPDETPKSAQADEVPAEEKADEVSATEEVADESTIDLGQVVEEAVKSALESVKAEIDTLRAEKEQAVEKSVKLETELATALSKSVAGGPKRTAIKLGAQSNDYLVKAATYKAKAEATTDPVLAKGYKDLAKEFFAKAGQPVDDNE